MVSLDTLRGERVFAALADPETPPYDLVVFDEAPKLGATRDGGRARKTRRYRLAEALAGCPLAPEHSVLAWSARHVLLLTATPHMLDHAGRLFENRSLRWHMPVALTDEGERRARRQPGAGLTSEVVRKMHRLEEQRGYVVRRFGSTNRRMYAGRRRPGRRTQKEPGRGTNREASRSVSFSMPIDSGWLPLLGRRVQDEIAKRLAP